VVLTATANMHVCDCLQVKRTCNTRHFYISGSPIIKKR